MRWIVGFFIIVASIASAEDVSSPATYTLDTADSKITFDCEADLHDFSGTGTGLTGHATFDTARGTQKVGGKVELTVASLDTGDKDRDSDMREDVLPAKKFPLISFVPTEVTAGASLDKGGAADLKGTMTINGVAKEMTLKVQLTWPKTGTLQVKGSKKFKLTDFKIDPPGAIWPMRVHDEMTFHIDLTFKRS